MNIKLKKEQDIRILCADDIYAVMQKILLRENKIDRNREHFWTISLDNANKILNIELVSMGSVNQTVVEPMEVFSIPLQKRAVQVILIHNHPGGNMKASPNDKDLTDRLIQVGIIMQVPVLDHIIISEKTYMSFEDTGLLTELKKSTKYVPDYIMKQRMKKQVEELLTSKIEERKAREVAKAMKTKGYKVEEIMELTGLSKGVIGRMRG